MIRFLIDENLSPALVATAHEFQHVAFHVAHRGWASLKDPQVLRRMRDEDLTLVTNNWQDFEPMLRREEVHPAPSSSCPPCDATGRWSCSGPRCKRCAGMGWTWSTPCSR
ncbi:MAG: toxin-antitoxin system, toxin component, family protein [Gemmatimonadetes bacterium]|nr:toxin-antitoxin system, toxin component, family protein [Gemmatimonadota bacterium]